MVWHLHMHIGPKMSSQKSDLINFSGKVWASRTASFRGQEIFPMMSGDAPRHIKEVSSKKNAIFFFEVLSLVPHFRDSSNYNSQCQKDYRGVYFDWEFLYLPLWGLEVGRSEVGKVGRSEDGKDGRLVGRLEGQKVGGSGGQNVRRWKVGRWDGGGLRKYSKSNQTFQTKTSWKLISSTIRIPSTQKIWVVTFGQDLPTKYTAL